MIKMLAIAAALLLLPTAASAREVFGGLYKHNVDTPLSLAKDSKAGSMSSSAIAAAGSCPGQSFNLM